MLIPATTPPRPLALGEYGTLYVIGFALVSIAAQLAVRSVEEWARTGAKDRAEAANLAMDSANPDYNAVEDVALFVAEQVFNLLKLMFAALSGRYARNHEIHVGAPPPPAAAHRRALPGHHRYVVSLFSSSPNAGFTLFIVASTVVLLKLAEHAARREIENERKRRERQNNLRRERERKNKS